MLPHTVHKTEMDHMCLCKSIHFFFLRKHRRYSQTGKDLLGKSQSTLTVLEKYIKHRNNIAQ